MSTDPSEVLSIVFGRELLDALDAYAAARRRERSAIIREAVAKQIGRKDLAVKVRRGRPPKDLSSG